MVAEPGAPELSPRARYMRDWRARNGDEANRRRSAARTRALAELGRRHRAELDALVNDELQRAEAARES